MKSIYAGGPIESQFVRLRITPTKTYAGVLKYGSTISVWDLTEEEYEVLLADADALDALDRYSPGFDINRDPWQAAGAWWRYSPGANVTPTVLVNVNGHEVVGYGSRYDEDDLDDDDGWGPEPVVRYPDLLTHLCDSIGASTEKNVCATAVEMANQNGLSLGELFTKLQPPYREPISMFP